MNITSIVLTGGPCSGKTTALAAIKERFSQRGYKVFIVPETATELISGMGISPTMLNGGWSKVFQRMMAQTQTNKQINALQAAALFSMANPGAKVLIVHDRGLMDQMAYISKKAFSEILFSITPPRDLDSVLSLYEGVIHMVTAAIGAEEYYNLDNAARSESPQKAIELDRRTLEAWIGHPHLRVVDNSTGFKEKIERVIREISDVLGDPVPTEREHKYLIKKPTAEQLKAAGAVQTNIYQTYLRSLEDGTERCVRQRSVYGQQLHTAPTDELKMLRDDVCRENPLCDSSFYYTEKKPASKPGERIEIEQRISGKEYLQLLLREADPNAKSIIKTRYCFVYENQYFELDIYPDDIVGENMAILEIELGQNAADVKRPGFIEVVMDVTGIEAYSNHTLAHKMSECF